MERSAEFAEAYLVVTVIKNGQPFRSSAAIYRAGDGERVTWAWTPEGRARFTLAPGSYDVKVEDSGTGSGEPLWFRAVRLGQGATMTVEAEF